MDQCAYQKVELFEDRSWKPFLRQLLVSMGVWSCYFSVGLHIGAPTVILPQMRREANSTDVITPEMASWIYSISGFAAAPWVIILPVVSSRVGRKYPFLFVCTCSLAAFLMLYFSNTAEHLLVAGTLQGPSYAASVTISVIIVTEYTTPKYRGIFLTLKSASLNWGIWVANALGTFLSWRVISIVGILCVVTNILSVLLWCESPYYLASKYRYEACSRSHRWVKGKSDASEKELSLLIRTLKENQNLETQRNQQNKLKLTFKTMLHREFYKPLLLCLGIFVIYHFSGKLVCTIYAIDLIKDITSNESTAYTGMLILDGVTVTGMYVGCGLSKVVKRRTLLIASTTFGIAFLYILSFYLCLVHFSVIDENRYVSLGLLVLFAIGIGCGPMILSTSIYGEMIPQKFKTSTMLITGMIGLTLFTVSLKFAPLMFKTLRLFGTFLFYGVGTSIILYFLYKYMPETKDKTLEEIQELILGKDNKT